MKTLLIRTHAAMTACIVGMVGAIYVARIVYAVASNPPPSNRKTG